MGATMTVERHGTTNGYKKGCRCDPCREAKASEERRRRERNNGIPSAQPVGVYSFAVTCPECGSDVAHVADGKPTESGKRSSVICQCLGCKERWQISVVAQLFRKDPYDV